ncbi:polyenoic fatty acid isomerase [Folsomia candida]|uniref:polyenoic fatty acid isomerase n=1 Tax=Folsomia candida TaxID=158441 RepID=UPI000B907537|nr:polyenoic fatty acid isomerase [Folsomia candida]
MEHIPFFWVALPTILLIYSPLTSTLDQNGHICIIGGGISGLTIAAALQSKGYTNVDLYEAEKTLGGRIVTHRSTGSSRKSRVIETGPIAYYRSMTHTFRYMNELKITSIPYNNFDTSLFNPKSGVIFPKFEASAKLKAIVQEATNRYKKYWYELAPALELGYTSPLFQSKLAALSTPIETWYNDRNLSLLLPILAGQFTADGYGDVKDAPILQALKPVVGDEAEAYFQIGGTPFQPLEGFDTFVTRFAGRIRKKTDSWLAGDRYHEE